MSMNLVFKFDAGGSIDFPFQTPTVLTEAVMEIADKEVQKQRLFAYIDANDYYKDYQKTAFKKTISEMLAIPNVHLGYT